MKKEGILDRIENTLVATIDCRGVDKKDRNADKRQQREQKVQCHRRRVGCVMVGCTMEL